MKALLAKIMYLSIVVFVWWLLVKITGVEHFIFPGPDRVFFVFTEKYAMLLEHGSITGTEMIIGLLLGGIGGFSLACMLGLSRKLSDSILPFLVISQALPVFAIAPLLVLWFGYGMSSKIIMTVLIVFFPVTVSTLNGFYRMPSEWIQTLHILSKKNTRIFFFIQLPLALPHAASGLRIACSITPIGAVVGEWVGSSGGLGYLMLYANGRGQTDLMFAALTLLVFMALSLWWFINKIISALNHFQINTKY